MATMINGQLILDKEYDENYQPTQKGEIFEKEELFNVAINYKMNKSGVFQTLD